MARRANTPLVLTPINRDVEAMLRKSQLGYFSGEGENVGKQLEDWIEKMDNYYNPAHSTEENRAMMWGGSSWRSLQSYGGKTTAKRMT